MMDRLQAGFSFVAYALIVSASSSARRSS